MLAVRHELPRLSPPAGSTEEQTREVLSLPQEAGSSRVRSGLLLAGILLLALALRLEPILEKGLWFDEAFSLQIARNDLVTIPRLLRAYDVHPPLHAYVLHAWTHLAGEAEWALRAPSVAAGVGIVALTYLLGRTVLGSSVGLLGALLVALSPFQIISGTDARMYGLLALLTLWASYLLWRALAEPRRLLWAAYAAAAALSLYTHYLAVLVLGFHLVFVVVRRDTRRSAGAMLAALVVAVALYAPWLPVLISHLTSGAGWPNHRPPVGIATLVNQFALLAFGGNLFGLGGLFRGPGIALKDVPLLLFPFLVLLGCGISAARSRRGAVPYLLGWWLIPTLAAFLVSLRFNIFYPRYFAFVHAPFALLLAQGVLSFREQLAATRPRTVALLGVLYLFFFSFPSLINYDRGEGLPYHGWREAVRFVEIEASPADVIALFPEFAAVPFSYYDRGSRSMFIVQRRSGSLPQEIYPPRQGTTFLTPARAGARLRAVGLEGRDIWLITTPPAPEGSVENLHRTLSGTFHRQRKATFGEIVITQYVPLTSFRPTGR